MLNLDLDTSASDTNPTASSKLSSASPTSLLGDDSQRNNNGRLTKRSSVDSGIYMAYGQTAESALMQKSKKTNRDTAKLSRLYEV